jgi:threonine dehydrogenase-like Zn-dependent dehydrogenase
MKAFVMDAIWDPKPEYSPDTRELNDKRAIRSDLVYRSVKTGLVNAPIPRIGDHDVLIKVGACGICGSDMHAGNMGNDGYTQFSGHLRLPVILGHEFSGEIVEVGKNVGGVRVGDLIAAEQIRPCGACDACKMGFFNNCRNIEEIGLSMDGGFCEYAVVPEKYCCSINGIADFLGNKMAAFEAGALAEPIGVSYNGIMVGGGRITPGTHVAVFGGGPIGLAAIALAKAAGAARVFAIVKGEERSRLAKACGADEIFHPLELKAQGISVSSLILESTHGIGCRTVVEAAGAPDSTFPEIVRLMSINARVVVLGRSPRLAPVDLEQFIVKGCRLSGSIGTAGSDIIPSVVRMMATGRLDLRNIITGRFPLADIEEGMRNAKTGRHGKVMISQFY